MSKSKQNKHEPEIVGRKFNRTRWAVHMRSLAKDEGWFSTAMGSFFRSQEEAQAVIDASGKRFVNCGGISMDLGDPTDLYEYRIVKMEMQCEVVHVETKKI